MKKFKISKILTAAISLLLFSVILLTFQNCAEYPEAEISSFADRVPMGFEVKVDTFAYMSCNQVSGVDVGNYGFVAKVQTNKTNQTAGIGLSKEFYDKTQYSTDTERQAILERGLNNRNTQLFLSVKKASDLQFETDYSGLNSDNVVILDSNELGNPESLDQLLKLGSTAGFTRYTKTLNSDPISGFIDLLAFSKSDVDKMHQDLFSNHIVALTFRNHGDKNKANARAPEDAPASQAYGQGFRLTHNGTGRALSYVTSLDLSGKSIDQNWNNCVAFKIEKSVDDCADSGTGVYHNTLPGFNVNVASSCVSPKSSTSINCYPSLGGNPINNNTGTCDPNKDCPHYITVCQAP